MNNARQIHLDLMCSLAHKQQDTIKKLNEQIEKSTTSYNGVLVWKIKVSIISNYERFKTSFYRHNDYCCDLCISKTSDLICEAAMTGCT